MNLISYLPSGPLPDNTLYIERQADKELLHCVQTMEFVTIIVPRHQGKTSLVSHLMTRRLLPKDMIFVYVDARSLDALSESAWYNTLCTKRILPQLASISFATKPAIPQNSFEWRDFLSEVAYQARQANRKIVVILDEIETAQISHNSFFFRILREIYTTSRVDVNSEFKYLTFVLIGAFSPEDLIKDQFGLTFNIGHRIGIPDFTLENVEKLLRKRGWKDIEQVKGLAARIYYWTGGQPYLTQYLCGCLNAQSTTANIDPVVEKFIREDTNNLPHIVKAIKADKSLQEYILRILKGENIPYFPNEYPWQDQLYLLGLIKTDANGCCEIRNRIYQKIITDLILEPINPVYNLVYNRSLPLKILHFIFVSIPRIIGRAVLDLFGRDKAAESTFVLVGYSLIFVFVLLLWGIIDIDSLINWFTSWWRFFFPV
jgi:hypothetical protein